MRLRMPLLVSGVCDICFVFFLDIDYFVLVSRISGSILFLVYTLSHPADQMQVASIAGDWKGLDV